MLDKQKKPAAVTHELSAEISEKYELCGGMQPTAAHLQKPWSMEVDFRTMTLEQADSLMNDYDDEDGNKIKFPFLKLRKHAAKEESKSTAKTSDSTDSKKTT